MTRPVEKDEIVRVRIIDISHEGKGIAKVEGYTIFVEGGTIDELVDIKIVKTKKNFGFARVVDLVEESKYKIEAKCRLAGRCGGCDFQDLDYKRQLKYKEDKVKNNIARIGEIEDLAIEDILGMEEPYHYRNNVQIPVSSHKGVPVIGYYKKGSKQVVDTDYCNIQDDIANRAVKVLREYMMDFSVQGFDRKTNKGNVKHLIVRTAEKTKDTMIVLVTHKDSLVEKDSLVDRFTREIPELKSLIHNVNKKDTGRVLGPESKTIFGDNHIVDSIGDLQFKISKESFFQVNPVQTEKLYQKVEEYLELEGGETLVDLYCGIGTIGMYLSKSARHIIGIEAVGQSVRDAKKNMKLNNISNMEFIEGLAEDVFSKLVADEIEIDALVVDPPRKGLDMEVIESIKSLKPKKLVYVSCEPSTLARDLKELKEVYKVSALQPVDMFPQTVHVESVCKLEKL